MMTEADRKWFQRQLQPLHEEIARLKIRADEILTAEETAPMCGYSTGESLLQAIRDNRCDVPCHQQGRRIVFFRGEVNEYIHRFGRRATVGRRAA